MSRPTLNSSQDDSFYGGFSSQGRHSEVWHAVVALVATIVGGGSLSVPWAVAKSGFAMGLALLSLSAGTCAICAHFLLAAARRHGGLSSYDEVLLTAAGKGGQLATIFSVVFTTFLTLVANQILLRQLLTPLANQLLDRALSHWESVALGCGAVTLIFPLTFFTSLNSLRHVGFLSLVFLSIMVVAVTVKAAQCEPAKHFHPGPLVLLGSAWDILVAIPVHICVFLCSFSALRLDTEMRTPTRRRMNMTIILAFGIALCQYVVLGISGSFYARCMGRDVPSNLLNLFDEKDTTATIMRTLLSVVLLGSLPLICLPCRAMARRLISLCGASLMAARVDRRSAEDPDLGTTTSFDRADGSTPSNSSGITSRQTTSTPVLPLPFMSAQGEMSPTYSPTSHRPTVVSSHGVAATVTMTRHASPQLISTPRQRQDAISLHGAQHGMHGDDVVPLQLPAATYWQSLRTIRASDTLHGSSWTSYGDCDIYPPQCSRHCHSGGSSGSGAAVDGVQTSLTPSASVTIGEPLLSGAAPVSKAELTPLHRALSSLCLMLMSMGIAALVDDVSVVWGLIGSTGAILLGLLFPCVAYVRLRKTPTTRTTSVPIRKAFAWLIILVSVPLIPACLVVAVRELLYCLKVSRCGNSVVS